MQIQFETAETFAIQSYSQSKVTINEGIYEHSLIVSKEGILTDWPIKSIMELENKKIELLLTALGDKLPEIIIVGHENLGAFAPNTSRELFMKKQIGFESMSIGAACRTYNVLLSESRRVVMGLIFTGC